MSQIQFLVQICALKILSQFQQFVFNYIDEIKPKEGDMSNCDMNTRENFASRKLDVTQKCNKEKPENTRRKTLTSPYAVSNPMMIDKREIEGSVSAKNTSRSLNEQMNSSSNISLPPNGYILPGKMKLGNALNIPAINSVYLASIPQNTG